MGDTVTNIIGLLAGALPYALGLIALLLAISLADRHKPKDHR